LKTRPVLIVQNDRGNFAGIETIVAAIRSVRLRPLPIVVPVPRGAGGLDRDSHVDAGHLTTVPMDALGRRLGTLPSPLMELVDRALQVSLGLE
jgi:mRNA interferase MazF